MCSCYSSERSFRRQCNTNSMQDYREQCSRRIQWQHGRVQPMPSISPAINCTGLLCGGHTSFYSNSRIKKSLCATTSGNENVGFAVERGRGEGRDICIRHAENQRSTYKTPMIYDMKPPPYRWILHISRDQ